MGQADNDDSLDHQGMAIELIEFTAYDDAGLAALTPAQRGEQVCAREALSTTSIACGKALRLAVWTRRHGRNGT